MQVKSFGCSFIFGSELADEDLARKNKMPVAQFSKLTWPAHFAAHLNCDYYCYAKPGSGNLQIMERVLSHTAGAPVPDLYIIGWSWIDRFDYVNPQAVNYTPYGFWKTIMPIDTDSIAQNYYKDLHSECRDKLSTLVCIKSVIDTLLKKNVPFIMTYMDELMFDNKWHTTPAITELQNYIHPYMTKFNNMTFLEWSRKNNFAETAMWHPLEQAHQAAADYIIQALDTKSIGVHCHLS